MREIKFRAQDAGDKSWFYIDMVHSSSDEIEDFFASVQEKELINLGEYTGLKDKNNKEIYEGDFVKFDNGEIYEVSFGMFGWIASHWLTDFKSWILDENGKEVYGEELEAVSIEAVYFNCEVIGNIFEDKTLLKEKP